MLVFRLWRRGMGSNCLHAQVPPRRRVLRINMDETAVKLYQDAGRGFPSRSSLPPAAHPTLSGTECYAPQFTGSADTGSLGVGGVQARQADD